MAGLPGVAAAQMRAVLYEIVETLGLTLLPGHRVSNWTAQGTAEAGSPFCPAALLPPGVPSCTITAFGMDAIDLSTFVGSVVRAADRPGGLVSRRSGSPPGPGAGRREAGGGRTPAPPTEVAR
jgi:hypothetical protein